MRTETLKKYFIQGRYMMRSLVFAIFFTAGLFLGNNSGECQEKVSTRIENTFHMTVHRPKDSPLYKWVDLMYSEIFGHLNVKLKLVNLPIKRSSIEANKGHMDGEPGRIYTYGASYPNLIRIEESVYSMTIAAYSADPSMPTFNGWESLRNTDYRVEYSRGVKICENNLSKVVKAEKLSNITTTLNGLIKLALGRTNIFIDDMDAVIPIVQNKEYGFKGKIHIAGIMQEVPMYMYVHEKHKDMVSKLTESIKIVKAKGLIDKYKKIAFSIADD